MRFKTCSSNCEQPAAAPEEQDSGERTIENNVAGREAVESDFGKLGPAVIEKVRTDRPAVYLKIVASLLPKDINLSVRPLHELSDDQFLARLAQVNRDGQAALGEARPGDLDGRTDPPMSGPE